MTTYCIPPEEIPNEAGGGMNKNKRYDMVYIYDKEGRIVDALFKRRVEKRGLLKRVLDLFRKSL